MSPAELMAHRRKAWGSRRDYSWLRMKDKSEIKPRETVDSTFHILAGVIGELCLAARFYWRFSFITPRCAVFGRHLPSVNSSNGVIADSRDGQLWVE